MKRTVFLVLLILSVTSFLAVGQRSAPSAQEFLQTTKLISEFKVASKPMEFFEQQQSILLLSQGTKMELIQVAPGEHSCTHYKFKQSYKQLPIFGAIYHLHAKSDFVQSANGLIYPNVDLDINPKLAESAAQSFAQKYVVNAKNADSQIMVDQTPQVIDCKLLLIDAIFPSYSGQLALAYKITLERRSPLLKREVFVDANSGRLIWQQSLVCHIDVPSLAKTKYYGTQAITSDSLAPNEFLLRDKKRGITTFSEVGDNLNNYFSKSKEWDLKSPNLDEVALDAHYCTARFYDMMMEKFNHKGLDGKGKEMNPVVILGGEDFLNAYWDGKNAYFGSGDCHHNPLTTLSVVGHEFTHGVTEYSSNLIYDGESGAINESLSDLFGKGCEYSYDSSNFTWELDPKMNADPYASIFRSFKDPNALQMPKTYKGKFWFDRADVHTNSSVLNHWLYLMVQGGSGKNEFGVDFAIAPIPMFDALKIIFDCQIKYLVPSSNYSDLFAFSKLACIELFGTNSLQFNSLVEAWKAVGITGQTQVEPIISLAMSFAETNFKLCGVDKSLKLKCKLLNNGNVTLPKSTKITLSLLSNDLDLTFPDKYIALTNDLLPGESADVALPTFDIKKDPGNYFLSWSLKWLGTISMSISDYNTVYIGDTSANSIKFRYAWGKLVTCVDRKYQINGILTNSSCLPLLKNSKILIENQSNGSNLKTTTIVLSKDLNLGEDLYFVDTVKLPGLTGNIRPTVTNSSNANNSYFIDYTVPAIVDLIDVKFSSKDYEKYFLVNNNYFFDPILDVKGNDVFATTGISNLNIQIPCLEDARNVKGSGARMLSCVDLSGFKTTTLSFDVNQFRADSLKYKELWENTSVMKVTLESGSQVLSKTIKGQGENNWVHHEIPLPVNYKGTLKFEMYNHFGDGNFVLTDNIFNYDAMLLDNVKIEKSTDVSFLDTASPALIFPNPANSQLSFYSASSDRFIGNIFSIDGILKKHLPIILDKTTIDVSDLNPGLYFLKVVNQQGLTTSMRFVKQ